MRGMMALGLGLLLLTGVATGGDAKKDADQLQGKWVGKAQDVQLELIFAKDQFTLKIGGDGKPDRVEKGTFKLDATKSPKEMDMLFVEGNSDKKATALCIYELQGDTFKWCAHEPGLKGRPKEFKTTGTIVFVTFKRVK